MSVRRALAVAAALPLLLAGCSEGDAEPKMPDPSPTSSSPTPTAEPTAEQETPEEFIRRWAQVEAAMENTGDTSEYLALSRACDACNSLAKTVEGYYADGGYVKWEGWTIRSVRPWVEGGPDDFAVRVDSAPTKYREEGAGPVKSFPGGRSTYKLTLRPQGTSWVVTDKTEIAS
jgi:hypothetical protein